MADINVHFWALVANGDTMVLVSSINQENHFLKNDFILISCGSRCILAKLMKICSSVG